MARITGITSAYVHAALLGLALAAGADGDPAVAATLHGVADEHYEQAGRVFEATEAGLRDRDHARLRARWAMPRSRPPTTTAARSAKPTPSPWPPQQPSPQPRVASAGSLRRRRPGDRRRNGPPAVGAESGRSWRCWPAGRPTPRSPSGCSCRSTRSDRIWSGSGTRPAPAGAPNWPATPCRPASNQSPLPPERSPSLTRGHCFRAVNGAVRPTLVTPQGAARPLPPSLRRAHAGSADPPARRAPRAEGAEKWDRWEGLGARAGRLLNRPTKVGQTARSKPCPDAVSRVARHAPGVLDSGERRGLSRPSSVRPSRRGCRHRSERAGREGAHNV